MWKRRSRSCIEAGDELCGDRRRGLVVGGSGVLVEVGRVLVGACGFELEGRRTCCGIGVDDGDCGSGGGGRDPTTAYEDRWGEGGRIDRSRARTGSRCVYI